MYLERSLDEIVEWWEVEVLKVADEAERLYDKGLVILHDEANRAWWKDLKEVASEIEAFIDSAKTDKSTQRLLAALETWLSDIQTVTKYAIGAGDRAQAKDTKEIKQDIYAWLLPRVLRLLRLFQCRGWNFPVPHWMRVIDSVILSSASASLMPDHIRIQSLEEISLDYQEHPGDDEGRSMETYVRTKLHLDGVRLNAHGISYYTKVQRTPRDHQL